MVDWLFATSSYMCVFLFFQAEDGIRDLVRSRGLGDVYKRQALYWCETGALDVVNNVSPSPKSHLKRTASGDERLSLIHI